MYNDQVNWIFSCGSKMTEHTHSFLFCGGGEDRVCFGVDIYGWCNVAHAKRTLHIKYPNMASGTMMFQYT